MTSSASGVVSGGGAGAPLLGLSFVPHLEDHLLTWAADVKLFRLVDSNIEDAPAAPPKNYGFRISDTQVITQILRK